MQPLLQWKIDNYYIFRGWIQTELARTHTKNATKPNPLEIIPLQPHKEREQLGDRRSYGESSCNSGDGTGQMVQPWMFMMMIFRVCFCSLRYPACSAHAPYCHMLPVCFTIFFHIITWTVRISISIKKKLLNIKCMFWLSPQLSSETFLILRLPERDMIINVHWSSCKVPPLCFSGVNETWNCLEKFSKNTKI